jgi:hypothetical protein
VINEAELNKKGIKGSISCGRVPIGNLIQAVPSLTHSNVNAKCPYANRYSHGKKVVTGDYLHARSKYNKTMEITHFIPLNKIYQHWKHIML